MPQEALSILITADNKAALASLKQTAVGIEGVAVVSQKATAKMADMAKGGNQAAQALTNVGRVAQDLPFGFLGIQNNLNPLLESFQRLKVETGSTGGALKALAGSLIGAGGVGLALSVVSSAFLIYQNGIMGFNKKTKESTEAISEETRALMGLNAEAGKTFLSVAQLVAADQMQITSIKQKQKIIEDLQSISNTYFGNLKIEKGEIVGLANAYSLYADNIFRVAQAKGAAKQAEKLSSELVAITGELNKIENIYGVLGQKQALVGGWEQAKNKAAELAKLLSGDYFSAIQNINRISQLTGKSEQEIRDYLGQKNGLKTKELQLTAQILILARQMPKNTNVNDFGGGKESTRTNVYPFKQSKVTDPRHIEEMAINEEFKERLKLIIAIGDEIRKQQETERKKEFFSVGSIKPQKTQALLGFEESDKIAQHKLDVENGNEDLRIWQEKNNELKKWNTSMTIASKTTDAFGEVLNSIANGDNVFSSLGDSLKKLLIDLSATVAKAIVLEGILFAINPAGYAAKKAAGALSGIFGGGFAKGGVSYGPQGGHMELLHGTEAVLTPAQMSGLVRNSMNAGAMSSMGQGGNQDMNISGEFVARGQDLVLALQRSNYSLNLRR